jgi:hypothetical protein
MKKRNHPLWTSTEASAVTGGTSTTGWKATGVCVRAEDIRRGDLYVASTGESLEAAFKKGAAAAIVSYRPDTVAGLPLLQVASTYDALRDLARAARFRTHATIIAVQGREVRHHIARLFGLLGHTHDGGKILSIGMANLPEDFDYGVFSLDPSVRPDIAIISGGRDGIRDGLFENMPRNSTAILNRDCSDFTRVASRARAAGVATIMSFGRAAGSDARIIEEIHADNGTQIKFEVLGEEVSILTGDADPGIIAASLLAARLCGKNIQTILRQLRPAAGFRRHVEGMSISLFDAVPGVSRKKSEHAVFRVQNMIDLGLGRQTAILDNISFPAGHGRMIEKNGLSIPRKIANLDFVYTCKTVTSVPNARDAIRHIHANGAFEKITPDVISPGDFLIFEQTQEKAYATFAEALRVKPQRRQKKQNAL